MDEGDITVDSVHYEQWDVYQGWDEGDIIVDSVHYEQWDVYQGWMKVISL